MKILWIFFGVITKLDYISGVISMHFMVFFKIMAQNGDIFGVAKISNIFWGCLKFLIYLGGEG